MTMKLKTFTSRNVTILDRTDIPVSDTNSAIQLQNMVSDMVKKVKNIADKTEQKIFANSEVKRLTDWMLQSMDWDAEEAIREIARSNW